MTRVQARKQRAIEALHRFGVDEAQLQIEMKKLEIAAKSSGMAEEEEIPDDGFMEAVKGTAETDWTDWENADEEEKTDI